MRANAFFLHIPCYIRIKRELHRITGLGEKKFIAAKYLDIKRDILLRIHVFGCCVQKYGQVTFG